MLFLFGNNIAVDPATPVILSKANFATKRVKTKFT